MRHGSPLLLQSNRRRSRAFVELCIRIMAPLLQLGPQSDAAATAAARAVGWLRCRHEGLLG